MTITVADQDKNPCRYARYAETPPYASGWQKSSYGKLGELTKNIRTFALPFENQTYTFKMQYQYDSYNRIQEMTYPDGERVRYGYNKGGMLEKVLGNKHGMPYHYIDSIHYNRFELKDGVWYGNGTRVTYDYDSLQRLSSLSSACADGAMQDIAYTYDSAGNILRIENGAGTLSNGLGGVYSSNYTYDNLYRLVGADGWWNGEDMAYQMQMAYHPNGRIQRKQLNALSYEQTGTSSSTQTILYDNFYHYNNPGQPNTLSDINEESGQQFEWDALGNMTRHVQSTTDRRLCWDEQNRLQGVKDNRHLSYYQYDANGDRTYKFTGEYTAQNQSGQWHYYYLVDQPTLYASPYLVANRKGYTKHYYAESERIASRIGGGGLQEIGMEEEWQEELLASHQDRQDALFEGLSSCLDAEVRTAEDALKGLYDWHDSVHEEKECYWYHPDHLGSSSWITFTDGKAVQHLHYLPWGEDYVNQRTTDFSARYTFSAKEKDAETGYSYFGARYYSSDLSVWLSVDPMAAKYPSLSPYVYCADNPVRLVDPNGDTIINAYKDAYDYFLQQYNLAKEKYINIDNNKDPIEYSNVKNEYDKASRDLEDISNFYKTTEVAISNVKKYNKQLYDQMNNIKDDKGNAVDIIVTVNYNIDKYGNHTIPINHVCSTSIIVQLNPIANFYEYKDMGEVLSHEFGHLLYIIPHWSDYQKFLETVGTNHNGHNYGDKSGEYADEQTQIYIHNKLFSR